MRSAGGAILLVVLMIALSGCTRSFDLGIRSPRSRRHRHEYSPSAAKNDVTRNPLALPFILLGLTRESHLAGGPNDQAAAARLRSAPIRATYWYNRYPPP